MTKQYYPAADETVIHKQLSNGLQLVMVPKPGYHRVYGILTTPFGSNIQYIQDSAGTLHRLPAGLAHFLEHKLFEGIEGQDAFELFLKQGASANAFTTRDQTSYLFSAAYNIRQNLKTLLDFVQTPHFTPQGVAKEKGIIIQEIKMYQDQPASRLHNALVSALYPDHPAGEDILGSIESVEGTSFEALQLAYRTFYQPQQMCLLVLGNIDPNEVEAWVEANQQAKTFAASDGVAYHPPLGPVDSAAVELAMDVSQPMLGLGYRMTGAIPEGLALLKTKLVSEIWIDLLMGTMSDNRERWLELGLIDESFYATISAQAPMHYLAIYAVTDRIDELQAAVQEVLSHWSAASDMNQGHFDQIIRERQGDLLMMFNSLEAISYELGDSIFNQYDYFSIFDCLEAVTLEDVLNYGQTYFDLDQAVRVTIHPLNR